MYIQNTESDNIRIHFSGNVVVYLTPSNAFDVLMWFRENKPDTLNKIGGKTCSS